MKLTKRKGFNFFRSYWDVYNELENEDKLAFIDALLNKQFLGIDPTNLKGMAKFAYISQTNSIDSQVKGYEDKTGIKLTPTEGGVLRGDSTPTQQVEVKEKVKEKVEVEDEDVKNINVIDEIKVFDIDGIYPVSELAKNYLLEKKVIDAVLSNDKNGFKDVVHLEKMMNEFESELTQKGETVKQTRDFNSHFLNWHRNKVKIQNNNNSTGLKKVGNKYLGII